ncbi:MAG: hypothetical protein ACTTJ6_07940 [Treponema sp.]
MKKCIGFLVAIFIAVVLLSCNTSNNNTGVEDEVKVSFESFNPRSISVKNNTGERLIAFKGAIELSSLISGVPANASNHGLRMDPNLFAETGDFALLFVTEKMFNENKKNLSAIQNKPFASLYAFYNKKGNNDSVVKISSKSDGNLKITLNNDSPFYAEIRMNSPEGEVLDCVAPKSTNIALNIVPGDYILYPIFKKYISHFNEIYSLIPNYKQSGKAIYQDFTIEDDTTAWNVGVFWEPSTLTFSSGGCYLTVENKSNTPLHLKKGDERFTPTIGINGSKATFFIKFSQRADGSYPDNFKITDLSIGAMKHPITLPEYEYKQDVKYLITVTGEQEDNLQLSSIQEVGKADINDLLQ